MRESLAYWVGKVGSFRQNTTLLPRMTECSEDGTATPPVAIAVPPGDALSAEVLAVGALVLVISRYNGGEPLLIASLTGPAPAGVTFLAHTCDEARTVGSFLASVRAEIEESRRQEPCALAALAVALGLDPVEASGLLRLGYSCGSPANSALGRTLAELFLHVERRAGELTVEVSTGAPSMARRLTGHVARAIAWLSAHERARLGDFDLLSNDDRRQVARDFNQTHVDIDPRLTLHGLVEARAAVAPDATALIYRGAQTSYRSLDRQANQLAALLRDDFGVAAGTRVGVMMERSEYMVIALLGALKAGSAYVPIDPRQPWDTVRYMLDNANISVLIVDSDTIAAAASFGGQLVVIDLELRGLTPALDSAVAVSGSDLAYVIYTSGSTGRPNGVAIEHRAIVNTILWRNDFYGIGPADVNLQIPSFAFDSSVVDIFCVLAAGGALVIPDDELRLDGRRLMALCTAAGVTGCIVTPSYYQLLVTEFSESVPSLRWITLAGESSTPELVAAHLTHLPGVALFNEYGPTENAVCSTACRLERVETTVSIGRPIWNVVVFILDAHRRLCPVGASGEIFLGGAGLARGYLNQDRLTGERFVPSPIPEVHQGPLYRTGDRGCWRPDGAIEFLGRRDSQVKIRGFRIELDDVELALRRHPGVSNGAVICKDDPGGAKYLAAYAQTSTGIAADELREHLRRQVPHYMVPDVVAMVPQLPLNLSGKVDRSALRLVDDFGGCAASVPADAVSPIEAALLVLWTGVLKRTHIARDDNFFSIGGNSLRVMELTALIRGELSIDVGLLDIYSSPTITELAGRLSEMNEERENANGH